jgi:hypothetical protein
MEEERVILLESFGNVVSGQGTVWERIRDVHCTLVSM